MTEFEEVIQMLAAVVLEEPSEDFLAVFGTEVAVRVEAFEEVLEETEFLVGLVVPVFLSFEKIGLDED